METVAKKEKKVGGELPKKSQLQLNKELIETLAEDIHPGCWDLDECEETPRSWIGRNDGESCGECDSCDDGYPEDCEDYEKSSLPRLLLHFPEVEIQNRNGFKHTITDFYISLVFEENYSKLATSSLFAIRSSATTKEYANGYFHSHANRSSSHTALSSFFSWRSLCLGGDTALTDLVYSLKDGLTEKALHELLVLLHLYVGWESLDGGPYYCMQDVVYPSQTTRSLTYLTPAENTEILEQALTIFVDDDTIPKPDLIGASPNLAISNTQDSLGVAIQQVLLAKIGEDMSHPYLVYLGVNVKRGRSTSFTALSSGNDHSTYNVTYYKERVAATEAYIFGPVVTFNGEPVKFSLILDPKGLVSGNSITEEDLKHSVVAPNVLHTITRTYIQHFTKYKLQLLL